MNQDQILKQLNETVIETLCQRIKAGDRNVMTRSRLTAAISGNAPLNENEVRQLLDSPKTLRLYRKLMQDKKHQQRQPSHQQAELASGLLKAAAAGDEEDFCITTEDFTVHFFAEDNHQFSMQLSVNEGLLAPGEHVALCDANQQLLMQGELDEDGMLFGDWPIKDNSPRSYLTLNGGRLILRQG